MHAGSRLKPYLMSVGLVKSMNKLMLLYQWNPQSLQNSQNLLMQTTSWQQIQFVSVALVVVTQNPSCDCLQSFPLGLCYPQLFCTIDWDCYCSFDRNSRRVLLVLGGEQACSYLLSWLFVVEEVAEEMMEVHWKSYLVESMILDDLKLEAEENFHRL